MNNEVRFLQGYLLTNGHNSLLNLGIDISTDPKYPSLINLKYNIFADKSQKITQVCRGAVVDITDYSVQAYAFTRFFNDGEHWASQIDWESASVYEKYDGSLIKLFFYEKANEWVVSTSGSVAGSGEVNGFGFSFNDLFWKIFNQVGYKVSDLDKNICYIFELCSLYNKVVVSYAEPRLILLTARDRSNWEELPLWKFSSVFEVAKLYNLFSIEQATQYAEENGGAKLEGLIVVDKNYNRLKIKSSTYVSLHNIKSNGSPNFLNLYKNDNLSEFLKYFPEYEEEFTLYLDNIDRISSDSEEFLYKYQQFDQKNFALKVKEATYLPSGYLFARKSGKIASFEEYFLSISEKSALNLIKNYG